MAPTVATKVLAAVITSSPAFIFKHFKESLIAKIQGVCCFLIL
jgi:hypothetical protein